MRWLMNVIIQGTICGGIAYLAALAVGAYDVLPVWKVSVMMVGAWVGLDLARVAREELDRGS